jgi:phage terminase large subunit-like protein
MRRLLIGHVVEPAKAEGDKESRATPYSAEVHKGNFFLPEKGSTDWDVQAFITEHAGMMGDGRTPRHDDQIDTAAYATMELLGHGATEMFIPGVDMPNLTLDRQMAMLDGGLAALFAG